ncbi:MAG: hypothetical protein ACYTXI_36735 [Nostoc sp.]
MNFSELNHADRDIADRIERMNEITAWMKADTEREFSSSSQQPIPQPDTTSLEKISQLTPEQIKEQYWC